MTRRLRFTLLVLVGTLVAVSGASPLAALDSSRAATGAASQPDRSTASPPLDELASCVNGRRNLAVVMLVDESGSLSETDPHNQRVTAGIAAINGLADLVGRSGGDIRVDLQIAGFGVDFERSATWETLTPDSAEAQRRRMESFARRNRGLDTDYVNALAGAQQSLHTHGVEMQTATGQEPCRTVLWFTDGRFDVEDRLSARSRERGQDNRGESQTKEYAPDIDLYRRGGGSAVVQRGRGVLCDSGGIADQYRSAEVKLLAVALASAIEAVDQEFLRSVVAGGGCGARDGTANGGLLAADDLGELIAFFDQVAVSIQEPSGSEQAELQTCPAEVGFCPQGTKTFDVDGSLRRFHVLAVLEAPGVAVQLTPPGAAPVSIPPDGGPAGSEVVGDVPISWSWLSDGALTIDAESGRSGRNWAGKWSVTFIDTTGRNPGAVVRARIYLFGDITPKLRDVEFRAGETTRFVVDLVRAEGTPIPPEGLTGSVSVTASVTDPSSGESVDLGPLRREADGAWVGSYRAPEDLTSRYVNLGLRTDVVTSTGIALRPSTATVEVEVLPPAGFPRILTKLVTAGPIVGTDAGASGRSIVEFEGSERSATCVWLDGATHEETPGGEGNLGVTVVGPGASESDCLRIDRGENASIVLQWAPEEAERGLATGRVTFLTRSLNGNATRTAGVDFNVQLSRPANTGVAWALFLLLMVLSLAVPLLIFYAINWLVGKFAPLDLVEGASVTVRVTETSVERVDAHRGLLAPDDFRNVGVGAERVREFTFENVHFEATVSRNPLRPPFGSATVDDRPVVGSDRPPVHGRAGRIPLWVTTEWVFVPDAAPAVSLGDDHPDDAITGRLLAFVLVKGRYDAIRRLNDELRDDLPALHPRLLELRPTTEPARVEEHPVRSIWDEEPSAATTNGSEEASPWNDHPTPQRRNPTSIDEPALPGSTATGTAHDGGIGSSPSADDDIWQD